MLMRSECCLTCENEGFVEGLNVLYKYPECSCIRSEARRLVLLMNKAQI